MGRPYPASMSVARTDCVWPRSSSWSSTIFPWPGYTRYMLSCHHRAQLTPLPCSGLRGAANLLLHLQSSPAGLSEECRSLAALCSTVRPHHQVGCRASLRAPSPGASTFQETHNTISTATRQGTNRLSTGSISTSWRPNLLQNPAPLLRRLHWNIAPSVLQFTRS